MKYLFFVLFLLHLLLQRGLLPASAEERNSISGSIRDAATQNPLAGATVFFPDLHVGATADDSGRYEIRNLPKGKFVLEVRYLGYATITENVLVNGAVHRDFLMSASLIEKNEVVITGVNIATELRKIPSPISIVRKDYLNQNVSTNIVDAISKLPGITQLTTGPAVSKPYIRGLGYNRVVVVNDGIRQEGQQWGDEHGIEIDDYNIDKIEVLKGPASLVYGSDALAGVINIISDVPVPMGKIKGNINANYQSNNGLIAYNANLAGNQNGFSWGVYGTQKLAHDYQNPYDGYVFNSKFRNANYGASIGLNKAWGYSRLSFSSFNQELGLVQGDRAANGRFIKPVNINGTVSEVMADEHDFKSYRIGVPRQRIRHQKLIWDNNFYLKNGGRIAVNLGYQQNDRREYPNVLQPDEPGLYFRLRTVNYNFKYFFPDKRGWQSAIGLNGMQQNNANLGIEFLIPAYGLFDMGAFAITRKSFDQLTLSGGLRIDNRSLRSHALYLDRNGQTVLQPDPNGTKKFTAFDRQFSNLSASVGLSYEVNKRLVLKLNAARGFRAPNIAELSANGVHEGTIKYEYGNQDLRSEVSTQIDQGLEFTSEHLSLTTNLFYNNIDHYIFSRKLLGSDGKDSIPISGNAERYAAFQYQQAGAYLYGGELLVDIHPHPIDWLHFENTLSYVKGILRGGTDSTKYLPDIPALRWISELKGEFKQVGKTLRNAYAKLEMDNSFAQNNVFTAYQTETPTPGYVLLNIGLGAELANKKNKTMFSLFLAVDNLANVAYQNHLSRLKYAPVNEATGRRGIYNTGRSFSVKLLIPLDIQ